MKKSFYFVSLFSIAMVCFFIACQQPEIDNNKDNTEQGDENGTSQEENSNKEDEGNEQGNEQSCSNSVTIYKNGTTSNGSKYVGIDDDNFYLDYIKYSIEGNHLIVSDYDHAGFLGEAKIIPIITYKGSTYEVRGIGVRAFLGCSKMTSITVPYTVTSIIDYAFEGCNNVEKIDL